MKKNISLIQKYFAELKEKQIENFSKLEELYTNLNSKINIISRKDIDQLYTKHILHSLGIAKIEKFQPNAKILDVGTGGGFPGIPLAILFPQTKFHLVDSIGKKIKVVNIIKEELNLENVSTSHCRVENVNDKYDFIVSRAVTQMPKFIKWVKNKTIKQNKHKHANGILYLKGGDLSEELKPFHNAVEYKLSHFFTEDFFETKKVVYLEL